MAITKKVTKKMQLKLLKIFYAEYVEEFGEGTRNLNEYTVLTTEAEAYLDRMPELREQDGNMVRYLLVDLLVELRNAGHMTSIGGAQFSLTPEGYARASMNRWDEWIDYANKNSGLAIPISLVALVVSVIALFVT